MKRKMDEYFFEALPCNISPYLDFHLAEDIIIKQIDPILRRRINYPGISDDGSAIFVDCNDVLTAFIHEGSNSYSTRAEAVFNGEIGLDIKRLTRHECRIGQKMIGVVIPEKQTIYRGIGPIGDIYREAHRHGVQLMKMFSNMKIVGFEELLEDFYSGAHVAFHYDSHLTNLGSILVLKRLFKEFNIEFHADDIKYNSRLFRPDLLNKFINIELKIPWVADGLVEREVHPQANSQRGLYRVYRNEDSKISQSCLIVGDSHSYSGLAPIASNLFRETRFYWGEAFVLDSSILMELSEGVEYIIQEISERFLYSQFKDMG